MFGLGTRESRDSGLAEQESRNMEVQQALAQSSERFSSRSSEYQAKGMGLGSRDLYEALVLDERILKEALEAVETSKGN